MASELMPVAEARGRILAALRPTPPETVTIAAAAGRVAARDVVARRTQPPFDVSAMDGYAARAGDLTSLPATLHIIGSVPAGAAFDGTVGPGEAVRIFTGAPVPKGADTIVIQEDTETGDGDTVTVNEAGRAGTYIRAAGLDFSAGDVGVRAGRRFSVRDVALAASMNVPWVEVHRRPRVAILATGDELVRPGEPLGANQIVSSNNIGMAALVAACGGEPVDLGIAKDDAASLRALAEGARGADLLVTIGGASVGDHDLVAKVLGEAGLETDFWRIAMRPGKPLLFGRLKETPMIGLPGNPVSALVCGLVFVRPAIARLSGADAETETPPVSARLGRDLDANDRREDYLRSRLSRDETTGDLVATPFERQDSSMLALLADADALLIRPPHAPAAKAGERVPILTFPGL